MDDELRAEERRRKQGDPQARLLEIRKRVRAGDTEMGYLRTYPGTEHTFEPKALVIFADKKQPMRLATTYSPLIDYCIASHEDRPDAIHLLTVNSLSEVSPNKRIGTRLLVYDTAVGIINRRGKLQPIEHAAQEGNTHFPNTISTYLGNIRAILGTFDDRLHVHEEHWYLNRANFCEGPCHVENSTAQSAAEGVIKNGLLVPLDSRLARDQFTVPHGTPSAHYAMSFDSQGRKLLQEAPRAILEALIHASRQE